MKHFNKFLVAFLIVGLLSSCTQRRYGHITGFQLNKKAKTEKTIRSGHYVSNTKTITSDVDEVVPTYPIEKSVSDKSITTKSKLGDNNTVAKKVVRDFTTSTKAHNQNEIAIPGVIKQVKDLTAPQGVVKKVKKAVSKKTKAGGLIYWILVLILLILIISLLEAILGQWLTRLLILIVLLAFVGHLLGLW